MPPWNVFWGPHGREWRPWRTWGAPRDLPNDEYQKTSNAGEFNSHHCSRTGVLAPQVVGTTTWRSMALSMDPTSPPRGREQLGAACSCRIPACLSAYLPGSICRLVASGGGGLARRNPTSMYATSQAWRTTSGADSSASSCCAALMAEGVFITPAECV
jgi:hypothetical protein